jgi:hypothetical protein
VTVNSGIPPDSTSANKITRTHLIDIETRMSWRIAGHQPRIETATQG